MTIKKSIFSTKRVKYKSDPIKLNEIYPYNKNFNLKGDRWPKKSTAMSALTILGRQKPLAISVVFFWLPYWFPEDVEIDLCIFRDVLSSALLFLL